MARTVTRNVTGLDAVSDALQALPVELRSKILREAVAKAGNRVRDVARYFARRARRTGALQASIESKLFVVKGAQNATATAIVGPTRDYFQKGGIKVKQDASGFVNRKGAEQPSRYAHLVEFGHAVRQPKKGKTIRNGKALMPATGKLQFVAPRPFMRPALAMTQGKTLSLMAETMAEGLERARRRVVKKGTY